MESILTSIKKLLGIEESYTHFDPDIIMNINTVLMALTQMGVGPSTGFSISCHEQKWSDFLGTLTTVEAVKSYIYLKVRLLFDPPSSSYLVEAMERQIGEFEWRLNVQVDNSLPIVEEESE